MKNWNWQEIQKYYDEDHTWEEAAKEFSIHIRTIAKYIKNGFLRKRTKSEATELSRKLKPFKHTKKTKDELSIWRKEYLMKNPDKIKWPGIESVPSARFKKILIDNNINFVEEYKVLDNRYFRIDIAFPDKKIGIEINGEQHYERDGRLKIYYKERHDLIEQVGWKLYEIRYNLVFNKEFIKNILHELKNNFNLGNIDYSFYIRPKRNICICGNKKSSSSNICWKCYLEKVRK